MPDTCHRTAAKAGCRWSLYQPAYQSSFSPDTLGRPGRTASEDGNTGTVRVCKHPLKVFWLCGQLNRQYLLDPILQISERPTLIRPPAVGIGGWLCKAHAVGDSFRSCSRAQEVVHDRFVLTHMVAEPRCDTLARDPRITLTNSARTATQAVKIPRRGRMRTCQPVLNWCGAVEAHMPQSFCNGTAWPTRSFRNSAGTNHSSPGVKPTP